jgi:hypothetical protein
MYFLALSKSVWCVVRFILQCVAFTRNFIFYIPLQVRADKGSFCEMLDTSRAVSNLRSVAFNMYLSSGVSKLSNSEAAPDLVLVDMHRDVVLAAAAASLPTEDAPVAPLLSRLIPQMAVAHGQSQLAPLAAINRKNGEQDIVDAESVFDEALRLNTRKDKIQYIAGYLLRHAARQKKRPTFIDCNTCVLCLTCGEEREFIVHKNFAQSSLFVPSEALFGCVEAWEDVFSSAFELIRYTRGIMKTLKATVERCGHGLVFLPECHRVSAFTYLNTVFLRMRIHHQCKLITLEIRDDVRRASQRKLKKLGTGNGRSCVRTVARNALQKARAHKRRAAIEPADGEPSTKRVDKQRASKTACLRQLWINSSCDNN